MPCDTIILNRVEISALAPGLLSQTDASMKQAGYTVISRSATTGETSWRGPLGVVTYRAGTLVSAGSREALAEFRNTLSRAYSRAAVYHQARVSGWKVRQTGPNTYEVQR